MLKDCKISLLMSLVFFSFYALIPYLGYLDNSNSILSFFSYHWLRIILFAAGSAMLTSGIIGGMRVYSKKLPLLSFIVLAVLIFALFISWNNLLKVW